MDRLLHALPFYVHDDRGQPSGTSPLILLLLESMPKHCFELIPGQAQRVRFGQAEPPYQLTQYVYWAAGGEKGALSLSESSDKSQEPAIILNSSKEGRSCTSQNS